MRVETRDTWVCVRMRDVLEGHIDPLYFMHLIGPAEIHVLQ